MNPQHAPAPSPAQGAAFFRLRARPNRPLIAEEEPDRVWPFGDGLERARLYRERCDAFRVRAANVMAAFDESLEPLRSSFLFKSQLPTRAPGAPANPTFNAKHPRARGGKFSAKPRAARPASLAGLVLPKNRGRWIGERGDGVWMPRSLKARTLAPQGVEFRAGFPLFEPHLHHVEAQNIAGQTVKVAGEVEMPSGFLGDRNKDFAVADRIIAQRMGWLKRDGAPNAARAERYRVEHCLVWHHHEDCERPRMLLIPSVVHSRAPHSGGHSLCTPTT